MGSISKSATVVENDNTKQSFTDKVKSMVNTIQGYVGTKFQVSEHGFVGLNYQHVPQITSAIEAYVLKIQGVIGKLKTDVSNNNALKGQVAAETTKYVQAVSDVANAYVTGLLRFADKMVEAQKAYEASDTQLSSDVSEEAVALSSSVDDITYTRKY